MNDLKAIADEAELAHRAILASENWSPEYEKDAESFAGLMKSEAKLERNLLDYFRGLADRAVNYVDWAKYRMIMADQFDVEVLITDFDDYEDGIFIQFVYDPVAAAVGFGVAAGEATSGIQTPLTSTSDKVSQVAQENIAQLVGKKVDKYGNIVDNPKAEYNITETTRGNIRESIKISLNLGEDQAAAVKRLQKTIKDPKRAHKIASTEAVNAYQGGMRLQAKETGATGKKWQSILGACPRCEENSAAGTIPIDEEFPSGNQGPSCHPGDRCGIRYTYGDTPN